MPDQRSAIAGSERAPVEGAQRIGDPPADRHIQVTLILRRRSGEEPDPSMDAAPLDPQEFAERYGASPADVEAVERFAAEHGLEVVRSSISERTVVLAGTIAAMSKAFGVQLGLYEHPELGTFRGRTGEITVPSDIAGAVTAVLGLDDRPAARPVG
jgi:kumamolisin